MPKYQFKEWPKMLYNEAGVGKVFERKQDVPDGWYAIGEAPAKKAAKKPTAKKAKKADPKPATDITPEDIADDALFEGEATREEVTAELEKNEIEVPEGISNRDLEALATEKLNLGG